MRKPGDGSDLDAEAGQFGRAGMPAGQHHLQRELLVEPEVAGKVDNTHAAAAQFAFDDVAGHGGGRDGGERGTRIERSRLVSRGDRRGW
jgi:hypothetical protein